MAVPKKKVSKQRKRTRAANWKIAAPNLIDCPQCHVEKQSHKMCSACGYYNGSLVISPKQKKAE